MVAAHEYSTRNLWQFFAFLPNCGNLWQLLATVTNFCNFGQLLPTFANFCQLLPTFVNFRQLLPSFDNFCQLLPTFANFWQLLPTCELVLYKMPCIGSTEQGASQTRFWLCLIITHPYHDGNGETWWLFTTLTVSNHFEILNAKRKQICKQTGFPL